MFDFVRLDTPGILKRAVSSKVVNIKLYLLHISPILNKLVLSDVLNSFTRSETFLKLVLLLTIAFTASYSSECPLTKPA